MGSDLLAIQVENLSHFYAKRCALSNIYLSVRQGNIFGLVGPNGSGKSTLFKIFATLLFPTDGSAKIFAFDVVKRPEEIRKRIGVVFQSPAIDKKLTVWENLLLQGHLYGLRGRHLRTQIENLCARMELKDRIAEMAETLSGGLLRRLDLARSLMHAPRLLLLDEPTNGLDPLARKEIWQLLELLKMEGTTICLSTHFLEEADRCDEISFLHQGNVVASGTPTGLKRSQGETISLRCSNPPRLKALIEEKFRATSVITGDEVRLERANGAEFVPTLAAAFSDMVDSITVGKPNLEDLYIRVTGSRFSGEKHA